MTGRLFVSTLSLLVLVVASTARAAESDFEAREFKDAEGHVLKYRLLKPAKYDPKEKYPLVIFFHGAGERGDDNSAQTKWGIGELDKAETRAKYATFAIAPQCPKDKKWSDANWQAATHTMKEKPTEPMAQTVELVSALQKEFSIDEKRLYVTGLSMGGFGTWDLACRYPEKFAAAAPVCGGADVTKAPLIAKLPIWVFHGADDPTVKVSCSRDMVAALKNAGGDPKYTEFPGVGHASWVPAYADPKFWEWLFAQKK